eukprot:TRINITY_DN124259_c0_g1_i1.p1 TRINITY_DN124259_c0_g1~~TRINITY_DN124259_c0_g1_i1.p1  ORF type:complete len:517 (+),score=117.73 TRINITY_DN124259_c0_g1_i1:90-1640(+)
MASAKAKASSSKFHYIKPVAAAVQLLEKQLTSADDVVRKRGVESVPGLRAPTSQISDMCIRLLVHENWFVRQAASDSLKFLVLHARDRGGKDPGVPATETAGKHLTHDDNAVRRFASGTLLDIAAQPQIPEPPPLPGENPDFRPAKPPPTQKELDCWELNSKNALVEISNKLTHDDPRIREEAVVNFGRLADHAKEWAKPHVVDLANLVTDDDVTVRHQLIRTIDHLGAVFSGAAEHTASFFEHEHEPIRYCVKRALLTLRKHDGHAAADAATAMLASELAFARRAALQCLMEIGEPAAEFCEEICDLLEDEDHGNRAMAIRTLVAAGTGSKACIKSILAKMDHEDEDIRRIATDCCRALSSFIPQYARSQGRMFVEDMVGLDKDLLLRKKLQAIFVLGGAAENAEPYLEQIIQELEGDEWRIRRAVMHALEDLKEVAAGFGAQEVGKKLLHQEPDIRRVAVECLGRMGVHAGPISHRVEAMMDTEEDDDVKKVCAMAVERLRKCGILDVDSDDDD